MNFSLSDSGIITTACMYNKYIMTLHWELWFDVLNLQVSTKKTKKKA